MPKRKSSPNMTKRKSLKMTKRKSPKRKSLKMTKRKSPKRKSLKMTKMTKRKSLKMTKRKSLKTTKRKSPKMTNSKSPKRKSLKMTKRKSPKMTKSKSPKRKSLKMKKNQRGGSPKQQELPSELIAKILDLRRGQSINSWDKLTKSEKEQGNLNLYKRDRKKIKELLQKAKPFYDFIEESIEKGFNNKVKESYFNKNADEIKNILCEIGTYLIKIWGKRLYSSMGNYETWDFCEKEYLEKQYEKELQYEDEEYETEMGYSNAFSTLRHVYKVLKLNVYDRYEKYVWSYGKTEN